MLTEFRYRAYISYSHADERWAAWLQRALESYRVPGRLGSGHDGRPLPRRISPVFRDREDLSSARNLSEALVAALEASECLIVICSPSGAASKWVNEEIRQFQALGRANRVLCMIVDGDPDAAIGKGGCFPPALFDGVNDAGAVPLAADPRNFADGKSLAKLKLVAALLGVRLDELRRRDLIRQRRWRMLGGLAVSAALALAAVAVTSTIAERQQREKAEQMATFIVDLGEDLQSELDLESLARISQRAMEYLQDLDPMKLTPETSIRVGRALRQVGLVNLRQGKLDASLEALERSRQLLRDLNEKYPGRGDVLFELGQAEFYVGNYYYEGGDIDSTREPWQNYYVVAETLYDSDPSNRRWLLELSYASMNRLLLHIRSEDPIDQELLDETERVVRLAEQTLEAWPGDSEVLSHYSNTLAWAADAQLMACNLEEAGRYRLATVDLAKQASESDRSNNSLKHYLAYRHSGMARVLLAQGNVAEAEKHRLASLELLSALLAMDPSNKLLSTDVATNTQLLASVMRDTGRAESALALMREVEPVLRPSESLEQASGAALLEYSQFLLDYARLQWLLQDDEGALRALKRLVEIVLLRSQTGRPGKEYRTGMAQLRYLWWEIEGEDPVSQWPVLQFADQQDASGLRSCSEAAAGAELAIMSGDRETAQRQADYLAARGYHNPVYLRFCQRYALCSP
jgi:hypothetical protein